MNENSFLFYYIFYTSCNYIDLFKKFLAFNFLGTYFVTPKSDHLHENQPVLGLTTG